MLCILNYILLSFKIKFIFKIFTLHLSLYLTQQPAQEQKLTQQYESVEHVWGASYFPETVLGLGAQR